MQTKKLNCGASFYQVHNVNRVEEDGKSLWLVLNGEKREVADEISLSQLVEILKLAPERIAIELNQSVVRRADWLSRKLQEGDRIEIVHFVGGGRDAA